MKQKSSSFTKTFALALVLAIMSLPALAQHSSHGDSAQAGKKPEKIHVGKTGEVKFNSDIWAGDTMIPAGAYQFSHTVEGADHIVLFKKAGTDKEIARVKCMIEPLNEKVKQTTIYSSKDEAGKTTIRQVLVRGENVKHVF